MRLKLQNFAFQSGEDTNYDWCIKTYGAWGAGGLSRALGVKQREIEAHLKHVAKSVETQGEHFVIGPFRCQDCEFEFSDRTRTTKPSRCPKCRSEHIDPPMFEVREHEP